MGGIVVIVSRTEPARYAYLKHAFANDVTEVIVDRRAESRRLGQKHVTVERRRGERRRRDITTELKDFGWAVVRR